MNRNAPLKTYQDLSSLRENSKPGYKFKDQPVLVRVIRPQTAGRQGKQVDERLLPREYYQRPVFTRFGTQRQWLTDAQLTEHYQKQKQLKIMKERVKQVNKEQVVRQKSRSPPKEKPAKPVKHVTIKSRHSTSTEVQVCSAKPISTGETAAQIMKQINSGNCGDVVKQLTTHEKLQMVHGVMAHQKLADLKQEIDVINKFFQK